MKITDKEAQTAIEMQKSIFSFIEHMWGLIPQPPKPEYEELVKLALDQGQYHIIQHHHFQPFIKFTHITWQQYLILTAYQRAINGKDKREIATSSGHGIGKSASIAWIIFHFLFSYENCNIACTAPSKDQMFDVLWKEASVWHQRMKIKKIASWFDITSDKIAVKGREKQWWARAKTSSKDNPEALSGVHADDVLLLADEASAVHDIVYENGSGSLTNENYVFIMISNPTKDSGKFYRAFHKSGEKDLYQHLTFSSEDSPVVEKGYVEKKLTEAGGDRDDDLYRVRVRGLFPKKGSIESKNYYQLVKQSYLNFAPKPLSPQEYPWEAKHTTLGIDPAGKGQDETVWVLRDNFRAEIVAYEKISNEFTIARKTIAFLQYRNLIGCNIVIDNFGSQGANVGMEIANMSGIQNFSQFIYPINVGDTLVNERLNKKYLNIKAYYYDVLNTWLIKGGELIQDSRWEDERPALKFTYGENNKIKMMPKAVLQREKIKSPNAWEALMLTIKFLDQSILFTENLQTVTSNKELMSNKIKNQHNNQNSSTTVKKSIISDEDYLSDYL